MLWFLFVDTVTNSVNYTVDTSKSVATSAYDKGTSYVSSAKGTLSYITLI